MVSQNKKHCNNFLLKTIDYGIILIYHDIAMRFNNKAKFYCCVEGGHILSESYILNKISLTDDVLKNIIIMAPYLSEIDQNRVFGVIFGLLKNADTDRSKTKPKETG